MATVVTYLKPNLKSTYNLWRLLENDTVTCCYFDLPKRSYGNRYATAPIESDKTKAQSIVDWLKTNRADFTYNVLNVDNYGPMWSASPDLEILEYASLGSFDKISIPHLVEDLDVDHVDRRTIVNNVFTNEYDFTATQLSYDLMTNSLGNVNAVQDLPDDLLTLINDPWTSLRKQMIDDGMSVADIIQLEKNFRLGTDDNSEVELDGRWFVENHSTYGDYIESDAVKYPILSIHPYYKIYAV